MSIEKSKSLFEMSKQVIPGGVHSPVRAFKAVGGEPIYICKAHACTITDVDNNTYCDYCNGFGVMALGHSDKDIVNDLIDQVSSGTQYGTPSPKDLELAKIIIGAFPHYEQVRFVNSGTEAVMTAIRLARAITKNQKIIKISGSYHGQLDSLLVDAGSGMITHKICVSDGISEETISQTLVVPYNDIDSISSLVTEHKDEIAAVIIEPVMGNNGLFPHSNTYLSDIRKLTSENKILLIFDEVITGFRLNWGGAFDWSGVRADITILGKIIGGGLPIGAIVSSKCIMEYLAPIGNVYQAGTMSANPLSMQAGISTLNKIKDKGFYEHMNSIGALFDKRMQEIQTNKTHKKIAYRRIGSMFWLLPGRDTLPASSSEVSLLDREEYKDLHQNLLKKGIYLPPSVFEVCFFSFAHSYDDIEYLTSCIYRYLS